MRKLNIFFKLGHFISVEKNVSDWKNDLAYKKYIKNVLENNPLSFLIKLDCFSAIQYFPHFYKTIWRRKVKTNSKIVLTMGLPLKITSSLVQYFRVKLNYLSEVLTAKGWLLVTLHLSGTNTLAYFNGASLTKKKRF